MNAQILMFGIVIAISSVLLFLQGWLLLLNASSTQPLWILIGLMGVVGGFLNIRRIRNEKRGQD